LLRPPNNDAGPLSLAAGCVSSAAFGLGARGASGSSTNPVVSSNGVDWSAGAAWSAGADESVVTGSGAAAGAAVGADVGAPVPRAPPPVKSWTAQRYPLDSTTPMPMLVNPGSTMLR